MKLAMLLPFAIADDKYRAPKGKHEFYSGRYRTSTARQSQWRLFFEKGAGFY